MVNNWVEQLRARPEIFLKPCAAIIRQSNSMADKDSMLVSAMHMFGKDHGPGALRKIAEKNSSSSQTYRGPPAVIRAGTKIPVSKISEGRRTVYLGGRNVQLTGRPPKALSLRKRTDHNFCAEEKGREKKQGEGGHWNQRPSSNRSKAPHSLTTNVSQKSGKITATTLMRPSQSNRTSVNLVQSVGFPTPFLS